jgi:MFS superfamily sulfate permease-like transporter
MLVASSFMLAQETMYSAPSYFNVVLLSLLGLGAIGWLVAAVLGFSRARVFGPATRWFALAAVCLVIYHVQFVVMVLAAYNNPDMLLSIGAFFNLFIVAGAVCAIIGFARLVNPR